MPARYNWIADVLKVIPDPRAAWLWIRQPHAALEGQTPLSVLASREGRDRVVKTAKRDFVKDEHLDPAALAAFTVRFEALK